MAKVTLIKRTEPFCGGCMIQEEQLKGADIEYDAIDITEEPDAVEKYDLTSVPTVLIERDNDEVVKLDGFHPAEVIEKLI